MNINGGLSPDNASLAADQIRNEHNTAETEEATITLSEHERILKERVNEVQRERERERDDTYNREIAVKQARKAHPTGTSAANLVSEAEKLYAFLSATTPPQAETIKLNAAMNYQTGAEDRQRLVLKRVREILRDLRDEHAGQNLTVEQAYNRTISVLDTASWEF